MNENITILRLCGDTGHLDKSLSGSNKKMGALGDTAVQVAKKAQQANKETANSFIEVGNSANKSSNTITQAAQKTQRETNTLIKTLERNIAEKQAGGKGTIPYYRSLIEQRGLDAEKIEPYLKKLQEVSTAAEGVKKIISDAEATAENTIKRYKDSLDRLIISLETGGKNTSGYFRSLMNLEGVDPALFENELNRLDELKKASQNHATQRQADDEKIINSIKRKTAAERAGNTNSKEYFQELAKIEGIDPRKISPWVDELEKASQTGKRAAEAREKQALQVETAINRIITAEEKGVLTNRQYFESLIKQKGLDPRQFEPYLQKLDVLDKKTKGLTISYGQFQNAVRMAPAQFTDIITQLVGGQSPFLIAIQQGGQLRDSFGGFKNMFKGLASMITPAGVAIAGVVGAVTALSAAYIQGSKETEQYKKTVILAGGASTVTAGQMQMLAQKIANSTGAISEAKEALITLTQSGAACIETFELVATAIAFNSDRTGQKVEDLVKQFVKIQDDPVKAVIELSKNYDTLTVSVYEQVKALTDADQKSNAVILVQKKLAEGVTEAGKRTFESAGIMQKSWLTVKKAAEMAWAAMKGIGQEDPLEERLQKVLQTIAAYEKQRQDPLSFGYGIDFEAEIRKLRQEAQDIQNQIKKQHDDQLRRQQEAQAVSIRAEMDKQADSIINSNRTAIESLDIQINKTKELIKYYQEIKDSKEATNKVQQLTIDLTRLEAKRAEEVKREAKAKQGKVKKPDYSEVNQTVRAQAIKYNYAAIEKQYNLPHGILAAISMQESGGNTRALHPVTKAAGLFQFVPGTAKRFGVNVWDPQSSAIGAARYLQYLLKFFKGDLRKAISGYNAGEGRISMVGKIVNEKIVQMPRQTKKYTPRVLQRMAAYNNQPNDGTIDLYKEELDALDQSLKKQQEIVSQYATAREKLETDYLNQIEKINEAGFDDENKQKYLNAAKDVYDRSVKAYEAAQERKLLSAWDFSKDEIQLIHERMEAERQELDLNQEFSQSQREELLNAINAQESHQVRAALGTDNIDQALKKIRMLQRELDNGNLSLYQFNKNFDDIDINRVYKNAINWNKQDSPFSNLTIEYDQYINDITNFYELQVQLAQGNADQLIEIERQKQEDLANLHNTFQQQSMLMQLNYGEQIAGNLASMLDQSVGQQSAAYRALFATQKAFAIASSVIAIQNAIAQAAAAPFPANLAAMATVAAETANIVSSISAVSAGFASGGYTGDGGKYEPAGIVHKGEFVLNQSDVKNMGGVAGIQRLRAMANNQNHGYSDGGAVGRRIITKQHSAGALPTIDGVTQNFTINGNPDTATMQAIENAAKRGAQMGYAQVVKHLATGQGDVSKALKGSWTTSRKLS